MFNIEYLLFCHRPQEHDVKMDTRPFLQLLYEETVAWLKWVLREKKEDERPNDVSTNVGSFCKVWLFVIRRMKPPHATHHQRQRKRNKRRLDYSWSSTISWVMSFSWSGITSGLAIGAALTSVWDSLDANSLVMGVVGALNKSTLCCLKPRGLSVRSEAVLDANNIFWHHSKSSCPVNESSQHTKNTVVLSGSERKLKFNITGMIVQRVKNARTLSALLNKRTRLQPK